MAKADTGKPKATPKPKMKKEQYERFKETARELGIDDQENSKSFEDTFSKIVPSKSRPK
jgi:hypothetical protein